MMNYIIKKSFSTQTSLYPPKKTFELDSFLLESLATINMTSVRLGHSIAEFHFVHPEEKDS